MKKLFFALLFCFLLASPFAFSVSYPFQDGLSVAYSFNGAENLTDLTANNVDGSITGSATHTITGGVANSDYYYVADGHTNTVRFPDNDVLDFGTGSYSISLWVKDTGNTARTHLAKWNDQGLGDGIATGWYVRSDNDDTSEFTTYNAGSEVRFDIGDAFVGTWSHWLFTFDTSDNNITLYRNGTYSSSSIITEQNTDTAREMVIGNWEWNDGYDFPVEVDEIAIWKGRVLTSEEANTLYEANINGSNAYNYSTGDAPASNPYAHLSLKDLYDNSSLPDGTTCYIGEVSNTSVSGVCYFGNQTTGLNYSVESPLYFTKTGTATENATTDVYTYGAFPFFQLVNVEGSLITGFNLSSGVQSNTTVGTSVSLLLPPNSSVNLNASAENYYLLQTSYNTTAKDTSTNNLTGVYQSIVTINTTNAYTGVPINNFTGWAYHNETGYNYTFSELTNTTTINVLLGNYTFYVDVSGYSIGSANTQQVEINNNTESLSFSLYSQNSIRIYFYDEDDSSLITSNITTVISGNSSESTYYSVSGDIFVTNLTDGNYTAKISGANYTQKTYSFTVADRSSQVLNAYLSKSTSTVILTLIDENTFQTIEGASVSLQRLINSTWTTVESKNSDITGRAQFTYTIGVKYRFSISASGYNTRVFELDPIIFSSYNIQLTPTQSVDAEYGIYDITIFHYPKEFFNNVENNLSITFTSGSGSISSYGAIVSSPNGTNTLSGTNAYGDQLDFSFYIANATVTDRVNITLYYQSVYGENKTYSYSYLITGTYGNGTLMSPKNTDYGLGDLDKALIATGATILGAGLVGLFVGSLFGLLIGLGLFGYFVLIGFLSAWFVIPVFLIGALMLMRRSNE